VMEVAMGKGAKESINSSVKDVERDGTLSEEEKVSMKAGDGPTAKPLADQVELEECVIEFPLVPLTNQK
ncbi:hypothetical protein Ancab_016316, partial [Ancistrocladus abbreviatus]